MAYLASLPMLNDDATHMAAAEELKRQQEEMAAQREAATREALGVRARQAGEAQVAAREQGLTDIGANRAKLITGSELSQEALDKIRAFAKQGSVFIGDDATPYANREDYIFDRKRKAKISQEKAKTKAKAKEEEARVLSDTKNAAAFKQQIDAAFGVESTPEKEAILKSSDLNLMATSAKEAHQRAMEEHSNAKDKDGKAKAYAKAMGLARAIDQVKSGETDKSYARAAAEIAGMDADQAASAVEEDLLNTAPESRAYDTSALESDALQKGMSRYAELDPSGKMGNNPILPLIQNVEKRGLANDKIDAAQERDRLKATVQLVNAARSRYTAATAQLYQLAAEKAKLENALKVAGVKARASGYAAELNAKWHVVVANMNNLSSQATNAISTLGRLQGTGLMAQALGGDKVSSQVSSTLAGASSAYGVNQSSSNSLRNNILALLGVGSAAPEAGYNPAGGIVPVVNETKGLLGGKIETKSGQAGSTAPVEVSLADQTRAQLSASGIKKAKKPPKAIGGVAPYDPGLVAQMRGLGWKESTADGVTTFTDGSGGTHKIKAK